MPVGKVSCIQLSPTFFPSPVCQIISLAYINIHGRCVYMDALYVLYNIIYIQYIHAAQNLVSLLDSFFLYSSLLFPLSSFFIIFFFFFSFFSSRLAYMVIHRFSSGFLFFIYIFRSKISSSKPERESSSNQTQANAKKGTSF